MSKPITLAMFTSTKGHFGKDTYKYTIDRLNPKILDVSGAVAHIKWEDGDSPKLLRIKSDFDEAGFCQITTKGVWRHNDKSHYVEHAKDIGTLMMSSQAQANEFVIWTEDDIVLKGEDISKSLDSAMCYLRENPSIMCVRVLDREDIIPSLKVSDVGSPIFSHADCFSFRFNIMRSRDAYVLGAFMKNEFQNYINSVHIERYATEVLRIMSGRAESPFACFDLKNLRHVHIGMEDFDSTKSY